MRRATVAVALIALSLSIAAAIAGAGDPVLEPPTASIVPKQLEKHGDVRTDNYYWLNDRENPEVISYLEAENDFTAAVMAHTKDFEDALFEEIKGRIKQNDESVPYKLEGYYYYYRYVEGQSYRIHCRKQGSLDAAEEVMLDVNQLAEGQDHMRVRGLNVSSGGDILAYATDNVGRRIYTIRFKSLTTGEALTDVIPDVTGGMAWANDNKTLFYGKQDPNTLRSYQVYRHVLGTDPSNDALIYQEDDVEFSCYVWKTRSRDYVMIGSFQTLSSEFRFLEASDPSGDFTVFHQREEDHEYSIDHFKDRFYIKTNKGAKNFRLMQTPVEKFSFEEWKEVIPHREDVFLENFEVFEDYLVVEERKDALTHIRIKPWSGEDEHYIDFGEEAYMTYIGSNYDLDTKTLRYGYSSMTTPSSTYDYNMATREKKLMKRDEVMGDFDPDNYETRRLYATARDGAKVPISIVYRKGFVRDGENPLLLYGYGSYGYSMEPYFSASRLSLLDRGFAYAIAHVRGGQEYGRQWYEDGKLLKKKNTFTDFIDCAEYLVSEKYTNPDVLFAAGGSAGGLLMGAIANMRPDLFQGVVSHVPFVDVVTTMLDESIPLTTGEYDEWGNPNDKEYYDYMLSYSPYDNLEAKDYPNILVTTGLHDSQVQYWEPAKWVARLRALKTDDNRLLLKTHMDAGHSGGSGRFRRYRETAFQYVFMLDLVGYKEQPKVTQ